MCLVICLFLSLGHLYSCSTHRVTTQAELDLLSICTIMTGDLIVETSTATSDPITNLHSLTNLISVENLVIINNPFLDDISGLSNLDTVRGNLEIRNNPLLTQCCILNDLLIIGTIGGSIMMSDNAASGNCDNNGSNIQPCPIVPTLGTWSLIILMLLLLIVGSIAVTQAIDTIKSRYS